MRRQTKFTYGAATFTAELSAPPWVPADEPVGVTRWTATGVPASALTRRDALLTVPLRIQESEWLAFLAFLEYAQGQSVIHWKPDADEVAEFDCYLDAPALGDDVLPQIDADYPRLFRITLTLRGEGLTIPWTEYFGD